MSDWHKIEWTPEDVDAETLKEVAERYVVQEYWAPKGKKWPMWSLSIMHGLNREDYAKHDGYKVSIDLKQSPKGWFQTQSALLGVPAFIVRRLAELILEHVTKE